jgi:transposase
MKKKQIIVGIDVSKDTLDVFIRGINCSFVVKNGPKGFSTLLETICKEAQCKHNQLFICFENTGKYSKMLSAFLHSMKIVFFMETPLAIKKSLGITRGKNDRIDAQRIADYAFEKQHKIKPTVLPGAEIENLKMLLTLREKLVKHRTAHKNGITDLHDCYREGETQFIKELQEKLICRFDKAIQDVENEIERIIKENDSLLNNYHLIQSVKGIAKINAFYFIAYTANFTLFTTARAYACYCGIAPFETSSGTVKGRAKVHQYANKQLKSLLNMAASSVIQTKGEYRDYYNKRVKELGKSKMSTLNIVRNKLVYRVFAVVNRQTPYVDLYKFAA